MIDAQTTKVADALSDSWVYRLLPNGLWPYAQLARWERPIGWRLLMWPCWWSAALGLSARLQDIGIANTGWMGIPEVLLTFLFYLLLFTLGAMSMRGAGCTYNDLVDQNIDDKVARTRSRPLPSGRVTRKQALTFLILQALFGLLILLQFNQTAILLGILSLVTVVIYPFMKRITWWPQLFLGLAFSWGAWMGWVAMTQTVGWVPALLYIGCIFWVIGYDTIYAHQDIEDDALVGVKSTARLFAERTRLALAVLYSLAMIFWIAAFLIARPADEYLNISTVLGMATFLGVAAHMIWQIRSLRIDDPAHCLKLFKSNSHLGWILFAGLLLSALTA